MVAAGFSLRNAAEGQLSELSMGKEKSWQNRGLEG